MKVFLRHDRSSAQCNSKTQIPAGHSSPASSVVTKGRPIHVIMAVLVVFLLAGNVPVDAAEQDSPKAAVASPDGRIEMSIRFDAGTVTYRVASADRTLVRQSKLGLQVDDVPLADWQELDHSASVKDETWKPVWGKRATVRNHYRQLVVRTKVTHPKVGRVDLVFRAYDDGVAFRYAFPEADARFKVDCRFKRILLCRRLHLLELQRRASQPRA